MKNRKIKQQGLLGLMLTPFVVLLAFALFLNAWETGAAPGELRIISLDTHPAIRTPRMAEAWRIYEEYRKTLDQRAQAQSRIDDIAEELRTYGVSGLGGFAAAKGGLGDELAAASKDQDHAQQRARDLLAQWEAQDLIYGEFFLGPLENAAEMRTVRYGVNGDRVTRIDRIRLGLIRWDQALAAAQQSNDPERAETTPAGSHTAQKGGATNDFGTVRVTLSNVSDFQTHDRPSHRLNGTGFEATTDGKGRVQVQIYIDGKKDRSYYDYDVALKVKETQGDRVLADEKRKIPKDGGSQSLTVEWDAAAAQGGLAVQATISGGNPDSFVFYVEGTVQRATETPQSRTQEKTPPRTQEKAPPLTPPGVAADTAQSPPIPTNLQDTGIRFSGINGQVEVLFPGEQDWDFADLDTVIVDGTIIKSSAQSSAVLSFVDMSTFVLKEKTEIIINVKAGTQEADLRYGNIWANIKKMVIHGSMEIKMKQAVTSIKGTTIVLEDDGRESRMKVIEGRADFKAKAGGRTVELTAGQMVVARADGLGEIQPFDAARETAGWQPLIPKTLRGRRETPPDRDPPPLHVDPSPTQLEPDIRLDMASQVARPGERIVVVHSAFPITDPNAWIGFYDSFSAQDQDYLRYTFLANLTDRTYDVIAPEQPGVEYHFRVFPREGYEHGVRSQAVEVK